MSAMTKAVAAWGVVPDWVQVLARSCDESNQSTVARRLDYSGAVVSNVLANKYAGDMSAVEKSVRGVLMSETVECPIQSRITLDVCMANQAAGSSTSSPQRQRLGRTCPTCVNRHRGGNHHAE